jgi:hypothetical protein
MAIGQQGAKLLGGRARTENRQLSEDVAKVSEGIDAVAPAGGNQAEVDRRRVGTTIAAAK